VLAGSLAESLEQEGVSKKVGKQGMREGDEKVNMEEVESYARMKMS